MRSLVRCTPLLLALALMGCSRRGATEMAPDDVDHLNKIGAAYLNALAKNGRPPANAKEAWPFLQEQGDPETLLKSPVDGQPYVVLWGVNWPTIPIKEMPPPIVAYEKAGKGGTRYVYTVMGVMPMTDEEFARAQFIAKKP